MQTVGSEYTFRDGAHVARTLYPLLTNWQRVGVGLMEMRLLWTDEEV